MQVKVHVFSFNMIIISTPKRVLTPSYPFVGKFGRKGKGLFSVKPQNFIRGCLSMFHM